ncbi:glycosyltransferase [bacterium]|nr:glycosyltransferase [bacterium]
MPESLSIAHVLGYLAARFGGPPQVAFSLGHEQRRRGGDISWWGSGDELDRVELATEPDAQLFDVTWPKGWYRCPELGRELAARASRFDLFHIHEVWSYPQYAATRIARRKGIPYVLTPHGLLEPWKFKGKAFKKRGYLALMGGGMLQGAACLHAITPLEVDGLRRSGYKGPVCIIPNGVDFAEFETLPDRAEAEERWPELKGRRVALFLSRLSREKGLEELLPAWAELTRKPSYGDCLLVLAGPDFRGYRVVAEALVEKLGLAGKVLFTGMVRGREKMSLLARADVYSLPSHSEGFSMSILENMAAGTPVVITTGCNFPEVAGARAGEVVSPESGPLRESLARILDLSEAQREEMGRRGRDLVRAGYTWEQAARKMVTVYRLILEGQPVPEYPEAAK